MNKAPLVYTGADVLRFANIATIGCQSQLKTREEPCDVKLTAIIPKTRLAVAVNALPVPRSLVGKISGVYPYKTAYMMFEKKLNAQFQPRSAEEVTAVVEQYRNTPVSTVDTARVPLRPNLGTSTRIPPRMAPGTPRTAMMSEFLYVRYVEPSPNLAPLRFWMYGRKALYSGYPSPMKAQTAMIREVDNASVLVANKALTCERLTFSSLLWSAAVATDPW
jgi:hypothetical protein